MSSAIGKWGNSLALRLPSKVAQDAGLSEGTAVDLRVEGDRLVITPTRPKYTLSELLRNHKKKHRRGETDWGPERGKERV